MSNVWHKSVEEQKFCCKINTVTNYFSFNSTKLVLRNGNRIPPAGVVLYYKEQTKLTKFLPHTFYISCHFCVTSKLWGPLMASYAYLYLYIVFVTFCTRTLNGAASFYFPCLFGCTSHTLVM